jgi:hypothetical protein
MEARGATLAGAAAVGLAGVAVVLFVRPAAAAARARADVAVAVVAVVEVDEASTRRGVAATPTLAGGEVVVDDAVLGRTGAVVVRAADAVVDAVRALRMTVRGVAGTVVLVASVVLRTGEAGALGDAAGELVFRSRKRGDRTAQLVLSGHGSSPLDMFLLTSKDTALEHFAHARVGLGHAVLLILAAILVLNAIGGRTVDVHVGGGDIIVMLIVAILLILEILLVVDLLVLGSFAVLVLGTAVLVVLEVLVGVLEVLRSLHKRVRHLGATVVVDGLEKWGRDGVYDRHGGTVGVGLGSAVYNKYDEYDTRNSDSRSVCRVQGRKRELNESEERNGQRRTRMESTWPPTGRDAFLAKVGEGKRGGRGDKPING